MKPLPFVIEAPRQSRAKRMVRRPTRQRILDTATTLFGRQGYQAVGIDRIVLEADVAKMTLYRHFPSKESLIAEVLAQRAEAIQNDIDQVMDAHGTPLGKLEALFDWYDRWIRSESFSGCMFIRAAAELGDNAIQVQDAVRTQKSGLVTAIAMALIEGPGTKPDDPMRLAEFMVMVLDGAIIRALEMSDFAAAAKAWLQVKPLLARLS